MLEERFREATGLELLLDYPGKEPPAPPAGREGEEARSAPGTANGPRMEQNAALALISQVFEAIAHQPHRRGIKSDGAGKYIELAFISPQVGERYRSTLDSLEQERGWRIAINPHPTQNELIHRALDLAEEAGLSLNGNPSVHQAARQVRLRLAAPVEPELLRQLQERCVEDTGFDLEAG